MRYIAGLWIQEIIQPDKRARSSFQQYEASPRAPGAVGKERWARLRLERDGTGCTRLSLQEVKKVLPKASHAHPKYISGENALKSSCVFIFCFVKFQLQEVLGRILWLSSEVSIDLSARLRCLRCLLLFFLLHLLIIHLHHVWHRS